MFHALGDGNQGAVKKAAGPFHVYVILTWKECARFLIIWKMYIFLFAVFYALF